jgi:hypothetical protein
MNLLLFYGVVVVFMLVLMGITKYKERQAERKLNATLQEHIAEETESASKRKKRNKKTRKNKTKGGHGQRVEAGAEEGGAEMPGESEDEAREANEDEGHDDCSAANTVAEALAKEEDRTIEEEEVVKANAALQAENEAAAATTAAASAAAAANERQQRDNVKTAQEAEKGEERKAAAAKAKGGLEEPPTAAVTAEASEEPMSNSPLDDFADFDLETALRVSLTSEAGGMTPGADDSVDKDDDPEMRKGKAMSKAVHKAEKRTFPLATINERFNIDAEKVEDDDRCLGRGVSKLAYSNDPAKFRDMVAVEGIKLLPGVAYDFANVR